MPWQIFSLYNLFMLHVDEWVQLLFPAFWEIPTNKRGRLWIIEVTIGFLKQIFWA